MLTEVSVKKEIGVRKELNRSLLVSPFGLSNYTVLSVFTVRLFVSTVPVHRFFSELNKVLEQFSPSIRFKKSVI